MNRAIRSVVIVAGVVACAFARAAAEQDLTHELEFDVASVKPVKTDGPQDLAAAIVQAARNIRQSDAGSTSLTVDPGGRWVVRFSTLRSILQTVYPAYSRRGQIVGGPSWVDTQLFEIDARAPQHSTTEDVERMAKRLLADRFKLRVTTAMRALDVYALSVMRDDKKLGRGMQKAIECDRQPTLGPNGLPIQTLRPRCQLLLRREGGVLFLSGGAASVSELIRLLQFSVDRPIVDRTELAGTFAIRLEMPPAKPFLSAEQDAVAANASDIFTAMREQLGLSLRPRTESTTVLMIEHVEMPTLN